MATHEGRRVLLHTPKPWRVIPTNVGARLIRAEDFRDIAFIYHANDAAANADLIAAAPELLEAARATLKLWEDWQDTPFARLDITWVGEPPAVKLARAAIQKYEGRAA